MKTVTGEWVGSEALIESWAVRGPTAEGEKVTVKANAAAGATSDPVTGSPDTVKSAAFGPVLTIDLNVIAADPLFVTVNDVAADAEPTTTVPKEALGGLVVSDAVATWFDDADSPWLLPVLFEVTK